MISGVQIKTEEYRVIEDEMSSRLHEMLVSVLRSVARRRLTKTENPSARAPVNCKVCRIAIALY
jgi:outer membrane lipopolysaccharide assembly protein LptE/RlpB